MNPLVSVIIPCYKQAQYLGEAIESVLSQTYSRFEIIVVDDGSPDCTAEVVKRYLHVRYHRQDNQGVSAARNAGIRKSKGDCLVFLDADDRLLPNAFEAGIDCLEKKKECAFASGQVKLMASDGVVFSYPEHVTIEKDHYLNLLQGNYIWTPAQVMFRRQIFDSGFAYNTSRSGCADWDLYLRIAKTFQVCCHDDVVAEYRVHREGMTNDCGAMLKDSLAVLYAQWEHAKKQSAYEQAYRRGVRGVQEYYAKGLIDQIQQRVGLAEWKKSARDVSVLLRHYPGGLLRHLSFRLSDRRNGVI